MGFNIFKKKPFEKGQHVVHRSTKMNSLVPERDIFEILEVMRLQPTRIEVENL